MTTEQQQIEVQKSYIQTLEDTLRDIILECDTASKSEAERIEVIRYTAKAALLEE